jgi:hypothetical protein
VYKNGEWDLVDKVAYDSLGFINMAKEELPDSLKNKTKDEIKKIVEEKSKQRAAVQQEIVTLNKQRDVYIAAEKVKRANNKNEQTLETEVEKIIKTQARKHNMIIQ